VLHAEAGEHLDPAVVHVDGKMHDHFARGRSEDPPQTFIEIQLAGGKVETGALRLPWIDFLI